jgi:hypothetical protein
MGDRPEQNPPPLDAHSYAVLVFFNENVTAFVSKYGLLPGIIASLALKGEAQEMFLAKMDAIYEQRVRRANAERSK